MKTSAELQARSEVLVSIERLGAVGGACGTSDVRLLRQVRSDQITSGSLHERYHLATDIKSCPAPSESLAQTDTFKFDGGKLPLGGRLMFGSGSQEMVKRWLGGGKGRTSTKEAEAPKCKEAMHATMFGWTSGPGVWVLEGTEDNHHLFNSVMTQNRSLERNSALELAGAQFYEHCTFSRFQFLPT